MQEGIKKLHPWHILDCKSRERQFLERMHCNKRIRHFSNLVTKWFWMSVNRILLAKQALGGILTHQRTCDISINKIGDARKRLSDGPASRERPSMSHSSFLIRIQEMLGGSLHICELYLRQGLVEGKKQLGRKISPRSCGLLFSELESESVLN